MFGQYSSISDFSGNCPIQYGLTTYITFYVPQIFKGGSNFINLIKPRYILTEINSQMLSRGSNTTVKEYIEQVRHIVLFLNNNI